MMAPGTAMVWAPYCGIAPTPAEVLARWNLDPPLVAGIGLAVAAVLWRSRPDQRPPALAAIAVLAAIFVSPLCALSAALFTARTVHHLLLVAVAAPLLAWSLPRREASPLALATIVSGALFWVWHAPGAYAAALSSDAVYWLMQASLLLGAAWFWVALRTAPTLQAVGALLAAMVQMGLLGALITFAPAPLYAPHLGTTAAFGLTPLEDQQIAGLIMWAPAAALYLFAALAVVGRRIGAGGAAGARPG